MKEENNSTLILCANCGKGEECSGDLLKSCTACKMVKYCNRDCQIAHRPQHKKACKKRAAELHDKASRSLHHPKIVQYAFCHCHLLQAKNISNRAVGNLFAQDAYMG